MSVEQQMTMKEKLLGWMDAFNAAHQARNLDRLDELAEEWYNADSVLHYPPAPDLAPGVEGVKQFMRVLQRDFKAIHVTVEDVFGEGDMLAMRYTFHGTNAATGKKFHLPLLNIGRYSGGKVAEEWEVGGPTTEE